MNDNGNTFDQIKQNPQLTLKIESDLSFLLNLKNQNERKLSFTTDHPATNDGTNDLIIFLNSLALQFVQFLEMLYHLKTSNTINFGLKIMKIIKNIEENLKKIKEFVEDLTPKEIEIMTFDQILDDNVIDDINSKLHEKRTALSECNNKHFDQNAFLVDNGEKLNPYEEYYYETRQMMVNLLHYKQSQSSIELNYRPLLKMQPPKPNISVTSESKFRHVC